ncbi:MAG: rod shape-determining protein [Planctomycetota bacterium]|nr:MAG: rod shape-determining protein [Planctomycetota bacterium]
MKAFEWMVGKFSTDMGIDLGTANTLVCVPNEGIVLNEPSVVAVRRGTNEVLLGGDAVGLTAKEMLGKTPGNIQAIRPLKNGVIADFEITEKMLRYFIRKVHNRSVMVRPRIVIAIPSGITAVERRAVINSAERAGARKVYLVSEPMAAGIGAGMPVADPQASMIVDIGGGTTEVAVMSLFGLVHSESIRVAGDEMDEAIVNHLRRNYNLLVGDQTAERIKMSIGSAAPLEKELEVEVAGRDLMIGLPRRTTVTSTEIREALMEPVMDIIQAIRTTLENTPPELAADIVHQGITLAGGGALLRGLDVIIEQEVQLPVRVAEDPLTSVARGTGEFLDQLDLYSRVLDSSMDEAAA